MAKVEVGSWVDFLAALQVAENEITLTADLDGNDKPLDDVVIVQATAIHGEGHTIYNISTGTSVSKALFATNDGAAVVRVDKCNFYNLFRNEKYPFFQSYTFDWGRDDAWRGWHFTECNFQGRGQVLFRGAGLYRCAVNWDLGFNGTLNSSSDNTSLLYAQQSYFDVKERLNTQAPNYTTMMSAYYAFNQCYIGGSVEIGESGKNVMILGTSPYYGSNPWHYNNCINVVSDKPASTEVYSGSSSSAWSYPVSIYNSDYSNTDLNTAKDYLIPCTTAEMKNAQALYDKGFDIVVTT